MVFLESLHFSRQTMQFGLLSLLPRACLVLTLLREVAGHTTKLTLEHLDLALQELRARIVGDRLAVAVDGRLAVLESAAQIDAVGGGDLGERSRRVGIEPALGLEERAHGLMR